MTVATTSGEAQTFLLLNPEYKPPSCWTTATTGERSRTESWSTLPFHRLEQSGRLQGHDKNVFLAPPLESLPPYFTNSSFPLSILMWFMLRLASRAEGPRRHQWSMIVAFCVYKQLHFVHFIPGLGITKVMTFQKKKKKERASIILGQQI